jgi:hypothetical protein
MLCGRSFFFMFRAPIPLLMILFQQYCALDATINDEIHRGCHLIVNSWQSRR